MYSHLAYYYHAYCYYPLHACYSPTYYYYYLLATT